MSVVRACREPRARPLERLEERAASPFFILWGAGASPDARLFRKPLGTVYTSIFILDGCRPHLKIVAHLATRRAIAKFVGAHDHRPTNDSIGQILASNHRIGCYKYIPVAASAS